MDLLRGLQKQLAEMERRAVPRGIRAATGYRNAGSPVASPKPLMNPVVATGLTGLGMTANLLSRGAVIPALIDKTKEVFNPKDNIITALQNFGTSIENQFAAPGQERRYVGSSPVAVAANKRLDSRKPLNAIETGKYGPTDWNPSANPLTSVRSNGAVDRAYQQEKARVTQMTEQDPMFKKYKVAELTAAYNAAKSPEEKERLGLQIWATTNPTLAAKLKPGQTGYQEVSSLFGTQTMGTNQPGVTQADMTKFAETVGAPAMAQNSEGFDVDYTTPIANFGAGVNAQQLAYSTEGEVPPAMIGLEAFNQQNPFNVPKDLLDQKTMSLLRQAFANRIK